MRKVISIGLFLTFLCAGGFWFLTSGPPHLVPGPDWPFTEQSRRDYRPVSRESWLTTQVWFKQRIGW